MGRVQTCCFLQLFMPARLRETRLAEFEHGTLGEVRVAEGGCDFGMVGQCGVGRLGLGAPVRLGRVLLNGRSSTAGGGNAYTPGARPGASRRHEEQGESYSSFSSLLSFQSRIRARQASLTAFPSVRVEPLLMASPSSRNTTNLLSFLRRSLPPSCSRSTT